VVGNPEGPPIAVTDERDSLAPILVGLCTRLRERGILTGANSPLRNVIELRPPLIFSESDADLFVNALDEILREDAA
jgi:4-aminobutyrate aminotransferase-like enzyme